MQAVRTGLRWSGESDVMMESEASGPWQLLGIVHALEPAALVSSGRNVQRVAVDASLPDGRRLAAISRDRVTVELDGCRQVYQLYRPRPIEQAGTCSNEADPSP